MQIERGNHYISQEKAKFQVNMSRGERGGLGGKRANEEATQIERGKITTFPFFCFPPYLCSFPLILPLLSLKKEENGFPKKTMSR